MVHMSAVPKQPGGGYAGLRMTAHQFCALGETHERYEFIEGVVRTSPRPGSRHQEVLWLIAEQARKFAHTSGGRCFVEVELVLNAGLVYVPDIMCFAPGRIAGFPARFEQVPDLVIEVLSPGNSQFDLTRKRDDYARCGVGEYWTVDSASLRVRSFRRLHGRFDELQDVGGTLACIAWPGFVFDTGPLTSQMGRG